MNVDEDVVTRMDVLNIPFVIVPEDVLNDVEVDVALLVEVEVLEDVNIDAGVIVLLDARVSEIDVLVLLLIVKVDVKVVVDSI